jgi:lysozyme
MQVSDFGLRMIEAFEGFPNNGKPYICPAGVLTQGFGHTKAAGGEPIGGQWSREKARQVLRDDLARLYVPGVKRLLTRAPTQGQFDAFVSFAFNCGVEAFRRSSIRKFFNRGEDAQAQGAFALWVKAAGKTMPGLVRRRASEALAYRGFQDLDFDGRLDTGEPAYGPMPQEVEQEREKPAKSRTMAGGGIAGAGGAAVVLNETVVKPLQETQDAWSTGTLIGAVIGLVILVGAGLALYAKWDDMGRPIPWR